jgi:hypothetical protein
MDTRRFTMTNSAAAFTVIAQGAWGHKHSDGDNDDNGNLDDGHNTSQRSRRRSKVSESIFDMIRYYPVFIT